MPSSGQRETANEVGEMEVNNSSSSGSSTGFDASGVNSEEARTPLLDEEKTGGGEGCGGGSDIGDGFYADETADGEGATTLPGAQRGGSDDPLDVADVAYGSTSFMAVLKPVAVTMTLSAAITTTFYADAEGAQNSAFSIYEVYDESSTLDSSPVRLGKSLVNAFIIVAIIAGVTFVIVILYWMRCMKCLLGYMTISSVLLLGLIGGVMLESALEMFQIPCDAFTYYGVLWNFAVVGVIAIFYQKGIPTVVTHAYLITTSIIMAWHLSRFEEWTGWCLLVVLALYDICAVLSPCGPLKALLHLMQEYDEPMPGLLYEAELGDTPHRRLHSSQPRPRPRPRPSGERETETGLSLAKEEQAGELRVTLTDETQALLRREIGGGNGNGNDGDAVGGGDANQRILAVMDGGVVGAGVETRAEKNGGGNGGRDSSAGEANGRDGFVILGAAEQSLELVEPKGAGAGSRMVRWSDEWTSSGHESGPPAAPEAATAPTAEEEKASSSGSSASRGLLSDVSGLESEGGDGSSGRERAALDGNFREDDMLTMNGREAGERRVRLPQRAATRPEGVGHDAEYESFSIKLGLGDFIFYSVLVTKAALYSFTAWVASGLVIVFGLGATLVLLAVYRMALPALPISIWLGTVFYLITRLSMQPYVEALNEAPLYF